jgi:hypothetical protein
LNSSKRGGSRKSRTASNKSGVKATGVVDFKSLQSSAATGSLPLQTQF